MMYNGAEMNALNFWSEKVTVQGHCGVTYAGTITVQASTVLDVSC